MHPVSAWANSASQLYTNPYSPLSYSPMARRIAAALDLTHRLGKDYEKPPWRIHAVETSGGTAVVEPESALDKPFCKLLHFRKRYRVKSTDPGTFCAGADLKERAGMAEQEVCSKKNIPGRLCLK